MRILALSLTLLASASAPAFAAATPKISGTYAMLIQEICQGGYSEVPLSNTKNSSKVSQIVGNGGIQVTTGTATFNAATHEVTASGHSENGQLLYQGKTPGMADSAEANTTTYAASATSLTLFGTAFHIVYGAQSKGVAQNFVASTATPGSPDGCAQSVTAFHQ